jgi:hypothetical protein
MKKLSFLLSIVFILTSCSSMIYYQVYKTDSSDVKKTKNNLYFEDENCKITYNIWEENGNIGFIFTNKTESDIYLNIEDCYFILNGLSFNYFQNRVFTNSSSTASSSTYGLWTNKTVTSGKSLTGLNLFNLLQTNSTSNSISQTAQIGTVTSLSKGYSTSYQEQKTICIPFKSSKIIQEFNINDTRYGSCDLIIFPEKKDIKTISFNHDNSPFIFSNRISYYIRNDNKTTKNIINEFWVTEITNLPYKEMIYKDHETICGKKSQTLVDFFRDPSPDKFYIKYTKSY